MKKILILPIFIIILLAGCEALRFTPTESQKQNAWLHNRTTEITAQTASKENTSQKLQNLTRLSELQSRAFVSYYGFPKEFPSAQTAEEIFTGPNYDLAQTALHQSMNRPDGWQVADNVLSLAIGIAALFGGVYGTKILHFLKQAKTKSKAIEEIIAGNELFKNQNKDIATTFKQAHKDQSPQTRQIVAQMK